MVTIRNSLCCLLVCRVEDPQADCPLTAWRHTHRLLLLYTQTQTAWRGQYRQLLTEGPEEEYGERRVNLLKAQLMQLERQVVLLSEGLSSQVCRCLDVEKALDPLTHTLRSLLCSDSSSAEVTITRSDLTRLIEMCSNVTQTLHRNNKSM
ncbi:hypothetical protein J4Q44_G00232080 [Coregonus suidteri]|uniref:Uncharacterized protein n=1 Tax=Coregonus suidteri TaxID=861788 RepID=A0AAN8L7A2_9TELE